MARPQKHSERRIVMAFRCRGELALRLEIEVLKTGKHLSQIIEERLERSVLLETPESIDAMMSGLERQPDALRRSVA